MSEVKKAIDPGVALEKATELETKYDGGMAVIKTLISEATEILDQDIEADDHEGQKKAKDKRLEIRRARLAVTGDIKSDRNQIKPLDNTLRALQSLVDDTSKPVENKLAMIETLAEQAEAKKRYETGQERMVQLKPYQGHYVFPKGSSAADLSTEQFAQVLKLAKLSFKVQEDERLAAEEERAQAIAQRKVDAEAKERQQIANQLNKEIEEDTTSIDDRPEGLKDAEAEHFAWNPETAPIAHVAVGACELQKITTNTQSPEDPGDPTGPYIDYLFQVIQTLKQMQENDKTPKGEKIANRLIQKIQDLNEWVEAQK